MAQEKLAQLNRGNKVAAEGEGGEWLEAVGKPAGGVGGASDVPMREADDLDGSLEADGVALSLKGVREMHDLNVLDWPTDKLKQGNQEHAESGDSKETDPEKKQRQRPKVEAVMEKCEAKKKRAAELFKLG